jgi:UPF0755 protein
MRNARPGTQGHSRSPGVMPRSPAEALEPTRAPSRPKGSRTRREVKRLGPTLRFVNALLTFSFLALAVGAAAVFWLSSELDRTGPLQEPRTIVVRKGEGARDIAQRLEQDGIISSQHIFVAHYVMRQLASWFGAKPLHLKAGDYELAAGMSMRQVAELIGEGKVMLMRLTVPEGYTSQQIVERLRAEPALTGDVAALPPEGSMLPDTYRVPRGATRQSVIEMMQSEQSKFLRSAWAARQPDLPLQSMEEALVLASIVERETGRNDKHADIASVFINRLKRGMPLQSDPTILYGLFGGQVNWARPIYKTEIQQKTSHNTYQLKGLPPTPICNPGRAAIQAVLNPSATNYLYFVASGTGSSVFSQTLEEHNVAVANWRKVEKDIRAKQAEAAKAQGKAGEANGAGAGQDVAAAQQPTVTQPAPAQPAANEAAAAGSAASDIPLPVRKPKR